MTREEMERMSNEARGMILYAVRDPAIRNRLFVILDAFDEEYERGVRDCFELAREQVDIGGERPIYRFNYNTADAVLEALKEGSPK